MEKLKREDIYGNINLSNVPINVKVLLLISFDLKEIKVKKVKKCVSLSKRLTVPEAKARMSFKLGQPVK